jgi:hypothetical protein
MTRLGEGDTSVPAIQMSDLNDADVIAGTQQEVDPQGRVRFHYVMPDGSPLESDWVMPDFVRKARLGWVEAVKQNIVAQASAARDATQRHLRDKLMEESKLEISESPATVPMHVPAASTDPVEHARACLVRATEEAQKWAEKESEARQKRTASEEAASRWVKVLAVLEES